LSVELAQASEKAREGKLSLDDMQGGGFTITNLGGIGGTSFTPIVNWPEVAILGMSRGSYEPVYNGQTFEPRMMLPLSLSYDHRVIDGADGARFLRWVAEAFEQPFMMAL
jgi:pyruvate dehydrogenase E2 component (dihydrolipoyllysine-residue acetyltransferase)